MELWAPYFLTITKKLATVQAKGGILREAPGLSAFLQPLPFHDFFSLYPESTQLCTKFINDIIIPYLKRKKS